MPLVANVKALCKSQKTSIPKLEKELEFGNGSIYNWDKHSPSLANVQKVTERLGVSIDSLLQ